MSLDAQKKIGLILMSRALIVFLGVVGVTCNTHHVSDFEIFVSFQPKLTVYFIYLVLLYLFKTNPRKIIRNIFYRILHFVAFFVMGVEILALFPNDVNYIGI